MNSQIKTFTYRNGEIQKVQIVRLNDWNDLDFVFPAFTRQAFDQICYVYENYIVRSMPLLFGHLILFHVPENVKLNVKREFDGYGRVADINMCVNIMLNGHVRFKGNKPVFDDDDVRNIYEILEKKGYLRVISGRRNTVRFIPVSDSLGFMSECEGNVKANSSFFVMDNIDCATPYDLVGAPIGLMVKNGVILNPPLFEREALLVDRQGKVSVRKVSLYDLSFEIGGHEFRKLVNSICYCRPDYEVTPVSSEGELVIIGNKVAAVHYGGHTPIPAGGFVLRGADISGIKPGDEVTYKGMEDITFGIQVGNSVMIDGVKTGRFISPFYDIKRLNGISYPPSLYPLNFRKSRAARMVLGSDRQGKPMIVWLEGAGKLGYVKGKESCGATLKDVGNICAEIGMYNGINLDGGGSAQILVNNIREMNISDRNKTDNSSMERPVPVGLAVR